MLRWLMRMGILYGVFPVWFFLYVACFYGLETVALFYLAGPLQTEERAELRQQLKQQAKAASAVINALPKGGNLAPHGGVFIFWVAPNVKEERTFKSFPWKGVTASFDATKLPTAGEAPDTLIILIWQLLLEFTELQHTQIAGQDGKTKSFFSSLQQGNGPLCPWSGSPWRIEINTGAARTRRRVLMSSGDAVAWSAIAAAGDRPGDLRLPIHVFAADTWVQQLPHLLQPPLVRGGSGDEDAATHLWRLKWGSARRLEGSEGHMDLQECMCELDRA